MKGNAVKVHRYRAAETADVESRLCKGLKFVEGYHYGVKQIPDRDGNPDKELVAVAGKFLREDTGEEIEKTPIVDKSICKKYLVHDPLKS